MENFTTKKENFQMKNSDRFHISEQNKRGGSNKYPQFMFLNRNKKINVYPYKRQFYRIKWGLRSQNYIGIFSWWLPHVYGRVG